MAKTHVDFHADRNLIFLPAFVADQEVVQVRDGALDAMGYL
jgi:hypothetical protein